MKVKSKNFFKQLRKEFWILFSPMLAFIIFDLISTYLGVCVFNGFEINTEAIELASRYGYLILFPYQIGRFGLAILFISYFYLKTERPEWKILALMLWSLLFFDYAKVLLQNFNNLVFMATGKQLLPGEIIYHPAEQLQQSSSMFYEAKKDFCRLI